MDTIVSFGTEHHLAGPPGPVDEEDVHALVETAGLGGASALMDTALEDVAEAIVVLDARLRVVAWNRAATLITGFPAAAAVGSQCTFAGSTLILDTQLTEPLLIPGEPAGRRFWDFSIAEYGSPLEGVVATVIPLRQDHLGYFVHLVPRVRLGEAAGYPAVPAGRGPGGGLDALTPREQEILRLLAAGKTAKPIAAQLSLSVPTVRTHIQHILRKLGVHSCLEAAVCFLSARGSLAMAVIGLIAGGPELA